MPEAELTYVAATGSDGFGVYAEKVGCLDTSKPCISEKTLLLEWQTEIDSVAWSPSGQQVAIGSQGNLFFGSWNGQEMAQIPSPGGSESWAHWSPDGSQIGYIASSDTQAAHVLIYSVATGKISTAIEAAPNPSWFEWVDGDTILYIAEDGPSDLLTQVTIARVDGDVVVRYPDKGGTYSDILRAEVFGDRLAISGVTGSHTGPTTYDVFVTGADYGVAINITSGVGHNFDPAWSPGGGWIAFESDRDGYYRLYVVRPDGTDLMPITDPDVEIYAHAWRPR